MYIPAIKGLKFPDEAVIRFFFKNELQHKSGSVLELGSSNGNNLFLFYEYKWDVAGVDISQEATDEANYNFTICKEEYKLQNRFEFVKMPMGEYVKKYRGSSFDVLLLPGSFYYTNIFEINKFVHDVHSNSVIRDGGHIMIRYRSKEDFRFGKGEKIGEATFMFNNNDTGEEGCVNTFFEKKDVEELFGQYYELTDTVHLKYNFENIQNNRIISNCDYIFWAKLKSKTL